MDLGAYPGTFIRLCRMVYEDLSPSLFASGLVSESAEINKYKKRADENLETKCKITDLNFKEFMKEESISFLNLNLDYCNSQSETIRKEYDDIVNYKEVFDIVTCIETIEHLHTPYRLFNILHRITKKGGVCVVETNNIKYLGGILKMLVKDSNLAFELIDKYSLNDITIKQPHVRFYSKNELKSLFFKAGFKVIKSYDFNCEYPLEVFFQGSIKTLIRSLLEKPIKVFPGFKSHIVVIAQKI